MKRPICAITGATGGIGAALSEQAARKGYDLVLQGRSKPKLTELLEKLKLEVPDINIELIIGDLDTSLGARQVASAISERAPKLDILFNNAGVLLDGIQMSPDGLEMHTQVNLIAPYILMQTLMPNVSRTKGTILNVSSGSALRAKPFSTKTLRRPEKAQKIFGAYATSKLSLSVVTQALGEEFAAVGVTLASVDPGPNKTNMTAGEGMPGFLLCLRPFIYTSPAKGAEILFETHEIANSHHQPGAFYSKGKIKQLPKFSQSREIEEMLLNFCHKNSGILKNRETLVEKQI